MLRYSCCMSRPNKPLYKGDEIASPEALAEVLGLTSPQMLQLAANASKMYRESPQLKKDGALRMTWDAHPQLKKAQKQINLRIFGRILFPLYLQGSIRDRVYPRDYARNANIHSGAAVTIALDIQDFFPSITPAQVLSAWLWVCHFPPQVAELLTKLTTKDSFLPQGAPTSSYLANLVLWENEHDLVRNLQAQDWNYSRLTDDITLSKRTAVEQDEITRTTSTAIGFIQRNGFTVKRSKLKVMKSNVPMTVNNLVINAHPALPKAERRRIRAQVHQAKLALASGDPVEAKAINSARGKIGKVTRFHPELGTKMKGELDQEQDSQTVQQLSDEV